MATARPFSRHPRGALTVSDRQRAAVALYRSGNATAAAVAAQFGIKEATLRGWVKKVEDAEVDARHLEALR